MRSLGITECGSAGGENCGDLELRRVGTTTHGRCSLWELQSAQVEECKTCRVWTSRTAGVAVSGRDSVRAVHESCGVRDSRCEEDAMFES